VGDNRNPSYVVLPLLGPGLGVECVWFIVHGSEFEV